MQKTASKPCLYFIHLIHFDKRDIVVERIWDGRKKYFPKLLRLLAKLFCSLAKPVVFSHEMCVLMRDFFTVLRACVCTASLE